MTAATPLLGAMPTRTADGTDWPATARHAASRVPAPWLRLKISLAPEVQVTVAPRRVSTKVSRTSPVTVPAGTLVTAVAALADSNVVAAPTWAIVAVVVDASRGAAPMPPTMRSATMMATSTPRMPFRERESAGRSRQENLPRRRGPVSSVLLGWFKPARGHCPRSADMSIPFGAI